MIKKIFNWLTNTKLYNWFILKFLPVPRFSMGYTKLKGWKLKKVYSLLQPGDLILIKDPKKLTAMTEDLFTDGKVMFSHFILFLGKDYQNYELIEMLADGPELNCFLDVAKECERMAVVRCDAWDKEYINTVIVPEAIDVYNYKIPYDTKVKSDNGLLYCSELAIYVDKEKRLKAEPTYIKLLDQYYYPPDCIYKAKNVSLVIDTDHEDIIL